MTSMVNWQVNTRKLMEVATDCIIHHFSCYFFGIVFVGVSAAVDSEEILIIIIIIIIIIAFHLGNLAAFHRVFHYSCTYRLNGVSDCPCCYRGAITAVKCSYV
jgi:hypothetical protein